MRQYHISILFMFAFQVTSYAQSNGSYCAEINRYNPRTFKESSYTLVVGVEDAKLVRINWQNGGYSDSDDFPATKIVNNGASFRDYSGVQFSIKLIKAGTDCFDSELKQCTSNTKEGNMCRNLTGRLSGRCHYHDD